VWHQIRIAYLHVTASSLHQFDLLQYDTLASSLISSSTWGRTTGDESPSSFEPSATGRAIALPALVSDTSEFDAIRTRRRITGVGDPVYLGGETDYDSASAAISPRVFELVRSRWGIRSVLDIGCGRGWSALWFYLQSVRAQCVEASPSALKLSVLPPSAIVNHDYTRGPWWPEETVDLVWSTNFAQQVSRPYMRNYFVTMKRAAIVLATFPREPGWHSVEIHDVRWWILQFERHGFVFNSELTNQVREAAHAERDAGERGPDTKLFRAISLIKDTLVFINPRVASLDAHDHLFPELGCMKGEDADGTLIQRECGTGAGAATESIVPLEYMPPKVDKIMSNHWRVFVKKFLKGEITSIPDAFVVSQSPNRLPVKPVDMSQHAVRRIPIQVERGNTSVTKVPVVVWPLWEFRGVKDTAESRHVEQNGIEESMFLELSDDVYNFHEDVIWVGDTGYAYGWAFWCGKFNEIVLSAQHRRAQLGLPTSWPIYIVDFGDYPNRQRCRNVEKTVGRDFVYYSKRSNVRDRKWDDAKQWVDVGIRRPELENTTEGGGFRYPFTPLIVRTDTVKHLQETLLLRGLTLRDKIESVERPVDVTHLWPLEAESSKLVGLVGSNLRSVVTRALFNLGNTSSVNVYVGTAGNAAHVGRSAVSSLYIEALLQTKILVVTQRDGWEDHYRLFEGIVAGSMVMTDRMLALPAGLVNGTSIIEFGSERELLSLINYYLEHEEERLSIAAEGRRVAMSQHRSWHRMEDIIFGRPLTTCSVTKSNSDCPYVVHTNEMV
jgi:hypothetical protein